MMARLMICLCLLCAVPAHATVIASKQFTESYLLAEMVSALLIEAGQSAEHKQGLGGSTLVMNALKSGDISIYPDYTGTLSQNLLQTHDASPAELQQALADQQLEIVLALGFNNSYALAMPARLASELDIKQISDLANHSQLRPAFSLEFLERHDGWPSLSQFYQLTQQVRGIEHALAYSALSSGQADLTDAYTTDGELLRYPLTLLVDDGQFFPRYDAVLVARKGLSKSVKTALMSLQNLLDENTARELNAAAAERSPAAVAREFLAEKGLIRPLSTGADAGYAPLLDNVLTHIKLTLMALGMACLVAIPTAVLLADRPRQAAAALYLAGLLQTIPSLALLALLIPLLGLGQPTAIAVLFTYSLLPILRNTLTGLQSVDPLLKQVADGMGLTASQRFWQIELPLAMPTLLAGVKTAGIISIGTATLAAFVGAGGLGEPIMTGLTLNNYQLILQGALPAAALAILTEFLFEWLERKIVPGHLRQQGS